MVKVRKLLQIAWWNIAIAFCGALTIEAIFGDWFSDLPPDPVSILKDVKLVIDVGHLYQRQSPIVYTRDPYYLRGKYPGPGSIDILAKQRSELPQGVEIQDFSEPAVVKLVTERKHLTDLIKMVAYHAESDLLALRWPHYARAEQEGRTLLQKIFAAAGNIRVSDTELHITLAPLSSLHRTRAAQALCDILD